MSLKAVCRGLLAVVAVAALAGGAIAQTMFYNEVAKDGRIYVFANGVNYDLWSKSGDVGKAITRPGYGPGGETVIFDSEDAINLYNYKHGMPGEYFPKPKEAPKPADNFKIGVGTTIFADYTYQDAPKITDSDKNSVNLSSFEVRRAYINVTGNISDIVAFRVTPDVAARTTTTASATTNAVDKNGQPATATATASNSVDGSLVIRLKYAFAQFNLDKVVTHGSWIRFGQQQTPYVDFMEGIYRYRFQGTIFVEREGYLSSSDVGLSGRLALPSDYGDIHLGYYNGDTYSKAEVNDQKAFQIRGTLRPFPKMADLKGLRLTAFYDDDHPVKNADRKRFIGALTFEHKYLNAGWEYIDAKDNSSFTKPVVEGQGWTLWATPKTTFGLEGLFRYDDLKPNKSVDAKKNRTLVGGSYWFKTTRAGLAAAVMADYEEVKYDTPLNKPTEKRFEIKTLFNY
ncbi:MAG TPA: hypothetical protein VMX54_14650 [Vicinamibacteria bacterium]|nr:hypothetical protein [Vicinamibacteria bacterium]